MSSPAPTSPPAPRTNSTSPPPATATASPPAPAVASPPAPVVVTPPPAATVTPPPVGNPPPVTAPPPRSSPPPPSTPAPATSPPPPSSSTTPVTSSPPPPSGSTTPSTPSVTPPTPTTPSNPGISPPSIRTPPPPPSLSIPPPSNNGNGSANGISTGAIAGIAVAGIGAILVLIILLVCCKKKKRRHHEQEGYYVPPPPPPGQKVEPFAYNWQQSAPPPVDHVVTVPPKGPPPLGGAARPPHPPASHPSPPPASAGYVNNSGSGSVNSGSETPLPPPSPGMVFAFSQSAFTYEELAMATDGFSDANLLGQGGFGYVHRGVLPNGKEVAVKQLKAGSGQGEREFQAEVEIISRVHHKHLVSLVGYCMAGVQRMLVYEFVPNNTLEFHLHGKGRPPLDCSTRLKIALGSAKGLAYLHEDCHPKIIHRDIKASNILLDFNFEAKVADFGLAKLSSDANTHISTRVMGTFGYLAPEYASSGKLTDKSDVFSFGVVLLELLTGRRPVDTKQSYLDDSLVDWARPLLTRALEEGNFDVLLDGRLQNDYNQSEVTRMVACAAASVRHSARRRPKMSQIVRALEGDVSLSDLNEGVAPGHSTVYSSHGSSDYDSAQYKEDMQKFRNLALASKDYASSEYSAPTSEYGLHPSGSSSEAQTTGEMEMGKMKKDSSRGFSGNS